MVIFEAQFRPGENGTFSYRACIADMLQRVAEYCETEAMKAGGYVCHYLYLRRAEGCPGPRAWGALAVCNDNETSSALVDYELATPERIPSSLTLDGLYSWMKKLSDHFPICGTDIESPAKIGTEHLVFCGTANNGRYITARIRRLRKDGNKHAWRTEAYVSGSCMAHSHHATLKEAETAAIRCGNAYMQAHAA